MKRLRYLLTTALCGTAFAIQFLPRFTLAQGSLVPPGPPGPTMLTLDQLGAKSDAANAKLTALDAKAEKRIPISSLPYTINTPGSYYLTGNLVASGDTGGITVNADDVTIDLNGFALVGGGQGSVTGISASQTHFDLHVRNGTIRGWSYGGIRTYSTYNSTYEGLRVSGNTGGVLIAGMLVGPNSLITNCVARSNSGAGISAPDGCTILDSVASGNGNEGISVFNGCTISRCTAAGNGQNIDVLNAAGIKALSGCSIINCNAYNEAIGIHAEDGSVVSACTVVNAGFSFEISSNCQVNANAAYGAGTGFKIGDSCYVIANTATSVETGFTFGTANRVDSNTAGATSKGFVGTGGHNFIVRNSSRSGGGSFQFTNTDSIGTIITASAPVTTTNPWANFEF